MPTYATYLDVAARVPSPPIGVSTIPSIATVNGWIDEAEAQVNNALLAVGLGPVPYTGGSAALILKGLVLLYAEGLFRQHRAASGGDGRNDDGKDLLVQFRAELRRIFDAPAEIGGILGGASAPDSALLGPRSSILGFTEDELTPNFTMSDRW